MLAFFLFSFPTVFFFFFFFFFFFLGARWTPPAIFASPLLRQLHRKNILWSVLCCTCIHLSDQKRNWQQRRILGWWRQWRHFGEEALALPGWAAALWRRCRCRRRSSSLIPSRSVVPKFRVQAYSVLPFLVSLPLLCLQNHLSLLKLNHSQTQWKYDEILSNWIWCWAHQEKREQILWLFFCS